MNAEGTSRRAWGQRLRIGALVLLAVLISVVSGSAQQTDLVQERALAYRAARSQHQAALDAWTVREQQWNDAVEEHERARRAGDGQRTSAALIRALDLGRELDLLERRVKDQRTVLNTARASLLAALDNRIVSLNAQLGGARTAADRARLTALLRDLENQESDLEEEGQVQLVAVTYYPSIQFDMRDTPQTLGYKAQLLRSKAEQQDSVMKHIDREIERIDRDLRRNRNAQSLVTGVERYGDIQVLVGAPNRRTSPGDVRARPDSAGVARPEMTPQQKIGYLRLLRGQVEAAKRQFLQRAADFENQARRIG